MIIYFLIFQVVGNDLGKGKNDGGDDGNGGDGTNGGDGGRGGDGGDGTRGGKGGNGGKGGHGSDGGKGGDGGNGGNGGSYSRRVNDFRRYGMTYAQSKMYDFYCRKVFPGGNKSDKKKRKGINEDSNNPLTFGRTAI